MAKSKPRKISIKPSKAVKHQVWVQPGTRLVHRWRVTYDSALVFRTPLKEDAVVLGRLLARLSGNDGATELFICARSGAIEERSTFPRAADPKVSKG